jgi:CRP/FNR family transcriptional regulator, dissimilatory nitrate respiration regulator
MLDTTQISSLLRHLPLFAQAKEADIAALVDVASLINVKKRQVVCKPSDPCEGFHVVVYGRVMVSLQTNSGTEKPLDVVEAGETFGDITMFLEQPYYLSATTLEDSLLAYIPRYAFLQLIERDSRFALRMLASLSLRMREVVENIESTSHTTPIARLAVYLLRSYPHTANSNQPVKFDLALNKNLIAATLDLAPETLSRSFRELQERHLISIEGKTVTLNNLTELEKLVPSL